MVKEFEIDVRKIIEIRDVVLPQPSFILNPFFDQGLAGWNDTYDNVSVRSDGGSPKTMMAWFPDLQLAMLDQKFGINLGVDWMTEFYLWIYSTFTGSILLQVKYDYSDGTTSFDDLTISSSGWNKKTLTPTAGKYIDQITFRHLAVHRECGISYICMVF